MGTELKGNVHHSVCRWTYSHLSITALCQLVKRTGFAAIDLVGPEDWPVLQQQGVYCSMCNGAEINLTDGWNHTQYHSTLIKNYTLYIELAARAGYKNLICFSGNRKGMDDETGLKNCAEGLKKVLPIAERYGITLVMELLNSKVDHPDYMCDKTAWGVALCNAIQSENFKLLYDIYHMQIDEGNVIATIRAHHAHIAHYHTAGVPGRHELNELQELQYPAIVKEIIKTGFNGYLAQEFIPTGTTALQKEQALQEAILLCDV